MDVVLAQSLAVTARHGRRVIISGPPGHPSAERSDRRSCRTIGRSSRRRRTVRRRWCRWRRRRDRGPRRRLRLWCQCGSDGIADARCSFGRLTWRDRSFSRIYRQISLLRIRARNSTFGEHRCLHSCDLRGRFYHYASRSESRVSTCSRWPTSSASSTLRRFPLLPL